MNLTQELESVLKQERHCLLTGDFDGLSILVDRKSKLSERLANEHTSADAEDISKLAAQARQNDALLQSALRGTKAALVLIREASNGAEQTTYSANGERRPLRTATTKLEQKI